MLKWACVAIGCLHTEHPNIYRSDPVIRTNHGSYRLGAGTSSRAHYAPLSCLANHSLKCGFSSTQRNKKQCNSLSVGMQAAAESHLVDPEVSGLFVVAGLEQPSTLNSGPPPRLSILLSSPPMPDKPPEGFWLPPVARNS